MTFIKTVLLTFVVFISGIHTVMAIEKPAFTIVGRSGEIEIREYAAMNVARTFVEGDFQSVGNQAFRRLAGYIFGDNQEKKKIAMTAPVSQVRDETGAGYWVTFSMPAEYERASLPLPVDAAVELVSLPAQTFAAIGYRGGWGEKNYRKFEQQLKDAINDDPEWEISGEPVWARYDPPIMPSFLRTNEILIPVSRVAVSN